MLSQNEATSAKSLEKFCHINVSMLLIVRPNNKKNRKTLETSKKPKLYPKISQTLRQQHSRTLSQSLCEWKRNVYIS
jgi:hypothetical protein